LTKVDDEHYQVLVSATKKIEVIEYIESEPYLKARVREIPMERIRGQKD